MNIKEKLASSSKKERTPQQQKAITVLNWVATAVCIVVIIFALVVAIFTIAGANEEHLTRFGDKIYMNVASDSMEPAFSTSDVLITKAFNYETQINELKVGQVITFKSTEHVGGNTYEIYKTHRIVKITPREDGTVSSITTRGDNAHIGNISNAGVSWEDAVKTENYGLSETVDPANIVATWGSVDDNGNFTSGKMLKGVGGFSNYIQDTEGFGANMKTRFFCIVVLPLILLFVIYAFILVRTLVIAKLENERKVQAEQVITVDSLSDEEKRRLAKEYLDSLQNSASNEDAKSEETHDETADASEAQEAQSDEEKPE